ncbi:MAG: hypothetical protein KDB07_13210 [Planctomycetes bacterium]|nr:hypothetical protein [Planctomycetota bacterium]
MPEDTPEKMTKAEYEAKRSRLEVQIAKATASHQSAKETHEKALSRAKGTEAALKDELDRVATLTRRLKELDETPREDDDK